MSTCSRRRCALLLLAGATAPWLAQADGLQRRGQGRLRFLGLNIYDATLRVAPGFVADSFAQHRLALELHYLRALKGRLIAERSLKEMQGVARAAGQAIAPGDAQRWLARMTELFPDVKAEDRIIGEHDPATGARFLLNGQVLGAVNEPAFSALFFGVWLSPHTSEPALRQALLGAAARTG
jgi:hypothetical protein